MSFDSVSGAHLRQIIEKVERLTEHKDNITQDIAEVYAQAKAHGYDVKVIREIIKNRKMDSDKLNEFHEMLALYINAMSR